MIEISKSATRLANEFADSKNLVVYVAPNLSGRLPASYQPAKALIQVNANYAFDRGVMPHQIGDLTQREVQLKYPKAIGAILHEAFHAKHSKWNITEVGRQLQQDETTALFYLEESRIEKKAVTQNTEWRVFLRALVLDVAVADWEKRFLKFEPLSVIEYFVGVILSRVEGEILEEREVSNIKDISVEFLGVNNFNTLLEVARAFNSHADDYNIKPTVPLLREWSNIFRKLYQQQTSALESKIAC